MSTKFEVHSQEVKTAMRTVTVSFNVERPLGMDHGQSHSVAVQETSVRLPLLSVLVHPEHDGLTRAEWEQMKCAGDRAWSEFEARFSKTGSSGGG